MDFIECDVVEQLKKTAKQLASVYHERYAPPSWAIDFVGSLLYMKLAHQVICYTMDTRTELVRKVLLERQPVNIGMELLYDIELMVKTFGFGGSKSGYSLACTQAALAPNIAVYCQTPVFEGGNLVHVINSIGFAFDNDDQEDYKYFIDAKHYTELVIALSRVYQMVFKCAKDHNLHKVALAFVGGGAFSYKFPGGSEAYYEHVYLPALTIVLTNPGNTHVAHGTHVTHVGLLGADSMPSSGKKCKKLIKKCGFIYNDYGYVPAALTDSNTLYQNAWDPHSIVGNGNTGDRSLDGYFGRSTAMGVLCFPSTNPYITIESIDV